MNCFFSISQIFATLLLQFPPVQVSTSLSKTNSKVMLFHEVWGRSLCRSLERMVEVEEEHPGGVEHMFSPGCVPLRRCSGCCSDENLECYPTVTRNVSMQLLRITPAERTRELVQLTFVEHHTCECRPRKGHLKNESRQRTTGRHRRRKERKRVRDCGKCHHPRG